MENKRKNPLHLLLDILIGILCLALVGAAAFALSSYQDSFGWEYDADSFYYRLSDGDYASMVEMYYLNEAYDVKPDEELCMYYGAAKYFEAASWYKAYLDAGEDERAAEYLARMTAAEEEMGALSMVAQDMRVALGISE